MGLECMIVVAHAFGRTLVVPPQQHLYLLGQTHKGTCSFILREAIIEEEIIA